VKTVLVLGGGGSVGQLVVQAATIPGAGRMVARVEQDLAAHVIAARTQSFSSARCSQQADYESQHLPDLL
jgi:NADPH:quinone reductase-like Zn-dependent oxidoreductase